MIRLIFLVVFTTLMVSQLHSQTEFINVTEEQGISVYFQGASFGCGASFYDFDGDGWDDLTFGLKDSQIKFFQNNQGVLEPITFEGIDNTSEAKSVLWVDFDNDGDSDFFVSNRLDRIRLFENLGDMVFTDISESAGLNNHPELANWGSSWADYDRDGLLDLYVCKSTANGDLLLNPELENDLYHNNGDGTFTEVSDFAQVGDSLGISFQSSFIDYDQDGWQDLMIVNDKWFENSFYRNNGDGTFADVGEELGMDIVMDAMCIAADDYDNDEDVDIYISNTSLNNNGMGNILFKNSGGSYDSLPGSVGLGVGNTCWGSQWIDYDNNGLQDLWNTGNSGLAPTMNRFFENLGNDEFAIINDAIGLEDNQNMAYSLCMGDLNNDGYPDVIQGSAHPFTAQVFENSGGDQNWIKLGFRGVVSNADAIGTSVKVYANQSVQTRQTHCGEGYISQNSSFEFIGLDGANVVDSLLIFWPNGFEERYYNLDVNQSVEFIEGATLETSILHEELDICPFSETTLASATSAESYLWNGIPGDSTLVVDAPGEYVLTCIHPEGFEFSSEAVLITLYPESETTYETTAPYCMGEENGSIELMNSVGLTSVLWLDQNSNSPLLEGIGAGEYFYAYSDLNGCFQSGSVEVLDGAVIEGNVSTVGEIFDVQLGAASASISGGLEPYIYDWSSGCQTPVCPNLSAGLYSLNVLDQNGCELLLEFEIDGFVGLDEKIGSDVILAPNPVLDVLEVAMSEEVQVLHLFDAQGSLLLELEPRSNQIEIDFTQLPKGMYHLVLSTGGTWYAKRVMKS